MRTAALVVALLLLVAPLAAQPATVLVHGMPKDEVRALWGEPDEVEMITQSESGGEETWTYYCGRKSSDNPLNATLPPSQRVRARTFCILRGAMVSLFFRDGRYYSRSAP